jgi:hypothetical protein
MTAFGPLENLRLLEDTTVLKGIVHVFGVLHHVWFIRVVVVDGVQVAVKDPHGYFDQLQAAAIGNSGPFQTVTVPEFPGDFVVLVGP